MAIALSRVHHFGILVSDMDRSRALYGALFGMDPSIQTEIVGNPGFAPPEAAQAAAARIRYRSTRQS